MGTYKEARMSIDEQPLAAGSQGQPNHDDLRASYQEVCSSYHALNDYRSKLLGFLPLASGAGIFFLLNDVLTDEKRRAFISPYLLPIGILGAVITVGLFLQEIDGLKRGHDLIITGAKLEKALGVEGQFLNRRRGSFVSNITPGSSLIFSAVLAGWIFIACTFISPLIAGSFAIVIFIVSFILTYLSLNLRLVRRW